MSVVWRFLLLFVIAGTVTADPDLALGGEAVQGGLIFGKTRPGSQVLQDGRSIRVGVAGDFVLGFTRDAPARAPALVPVTSESTSVVNAPVSSSIVWAYWGSASS